MSIRFSGESQGGLTLIELLVVTLILGILAAIALPAFFNPKSKASDAKNKEHVPAAQVTMEAFAAENAGSYVGGTATKLKEIEPSLNSIGTFVTTGPAGTVEPTANPYEITVTSSTGDKFAVINSTGPISVPTTATTRGGCPGTPNNAGSWG